MALDAGMLHRALRLGAAWVGGAGLPALLLAERILDHALPRVLVLGRTEADLEAPLEAIAAGHREGLGLNLLAVLPGEAPPAEALPAHRLRLGSLLCAVDAGLSCWTGGAALPRLLPGRIAAPAPLPLDPAPLGPLERTLLAARRPDLDPAGLEAIYGTPPWEPGGGRWTARLWPGVAVPGGAVLIREPLVVPTATPAAEALRGALRASAGGPVPFLPQDEDPSGLLALRLLTPEIGAFRGPCAAWQEAFRRLAALPAPPHFCARC